MTSSKEAHPLQRSRAFNKSFIKRAIRLTESKYQTLLNKSQQQQEEKSITYNSITPLGDDNDSTFAPCTITTTTTSTTPLLASPTAILNENKKNTEETNLQNLAKDVEAIQHRDERLHKQMEDSQMNELPASDLSVKKVYDEKSGDLSPSSSVAATTRSSLHDNDSITVHYSEDDHYNHHDNTLHGVVSEEDQVGQSDFEQPALFFLGFLKHTWQNVRDSLAVALSTTTQAAVGVVSQLVPHSHDNALIANSQIGSTKEKEEEGGRTATSASTSTSAMSEVGATELTFTEKVAMYWEIFIVALVELLIKFVLGIQHLIGWKVMEDDETVENTDSLHQNKNKRDQIQQQFAQSEASRAFSNKTHQETIALVEATPANNATTWRDEVRLSNIWKLGALVLFVLYIGAYVVWRTRSSSAYTGEPQEI